MNGSSIKHIQGLLALLQVMTAKGITMESHQYNDSAFGNFNLVLAAVHTKARFLWDGRNSVLTVEYQESRNEAATEIWKHDALISVPEAENVFAEIGSNAETMLS